jgi:phage shock protein C
MEPKRLYRSRTERVLAGVCGGLAEYFNVDPLLIRVLFVILALVGGGGFLIYLILWIVTQEDPGQFAVPKGGDPSSATFTQTPPSEPEQSYASPKPGPVPPVRPRPRRRFRGLIGGLVLITLGVLFLIQEFVESADFGDLWPILLVVIGLGLLIIGIGERKHND